MIKSFVKKALQEDIGRGDLFYLVGSNAKATATIFCKDVGVFAGAEYIKALCKVEKLDLDLHVKDGDSLEHGQKIATIKGKSKKLLMCERTLLNLIQHASGIATNTRAFVDALDGESVKILDTRKTRPHLRIFEKYAVRCGGGHNHRMGLDDCLMLKDTHLMTIDNLSDFVKDARKKLPYTTKIEIECENFEQVQNAMQSGADMVMCDNMSHDLIKKVVDFRNKNYSHILLEASGNITIDTVKSYAQTGVDAVSSGSLIHQAVWLDFSMKIVHKEKK